MAAGPNDLTTLARVKAFLKLTVSTDDALLEQLITGLSAWAETRMSRTIARTLYEKRFSGNGQTKWTFPAGPVDEVVSVLRDGEAVAATQYWFNESTLELLYDAFTRGRGNWVVSFYAGYVTTPEDLQQATTELVAMCYRERDRIGASSKSVGPETIAYITSAANLRSLEAFDRYRWVTPA